MTFKQIIAFGFLALALHAQADTIIGKVKPFSLAKVGKIKAKVAMPAIDASIV
jgi:hypothetical protein